MSQIFTTTDLSNYMNKTLVPQVAGDVVNAMNTWIENHTNRCWGTTANAVERHDWAPRIWLFHPDVTAISAIKLGYPGLLQSTLSSTSYFFNRYGRVTMYLQQPGHFNPSAMNNDLVEISYTYGVPTVPDDLKLASLGLTARFYNWAINGNKDVVSATVGTYKLEYSGKVRGSNQAPNPALLTDEANWLIIESYRMQRL